VTEVIKKKFLSVVTGPRKIRLHPIPLKIFSVESEHSNYEIALLSLCVCVQQKERPQE
jgi:hypothetical protein